MPARMTAIDAQFYWTSAKIPSDLLLLYAFDGVPTDFERAVDGVRERARTCPALTVRVEDGSPLTYPRWVPSRADHIVRHDLDDDSWQGCVDAVLGLDANQLDARETPWRIHLFAPVHGIPGSTVPSAVAVMQFAHALCDGPRALTLAAWLFGSEDPVPEVETGRPGFLPWRAVEAARAHRRQLRDTEAGLLPPAIGPRPALSTNTRPTGTRSMRTLVRQRAELAGSTATVATLAAVSAALSAHLADAVPSMVAEVTMAKPGVPRAHNHFANVTVGLYPDLDKRDRLQRIAADLTNARRRSEHPAVRAADRAFATTPAPLLRWGIGLFDPESQPSHVAGNTVVSSIYRVPTALAFGGVPVLLAAVYPGLSPVMSLVHGVWGVGDNVTVSVHAAESAVGDIDDYMARLDAEL